MEFWDFRLLVYRFGVKGVGCWGFGVVKFVQLERFRGFSSLSMKNCMFRVQGPAASCNILQVSAERFRLFHKQMPQQVAINSDMAQWCNIQGMIAEAQAEYFFHSHSVCGFGLLYHGRPEPLRRALGVTDHEPL